ncbi:MAG: M67 family metallopeptidase [Nitrospirota bacterium]|nr:M67 family metallopeptidase [Nitrospirota bacterium]
MLIIPRRIVDAMFAHGIKEKPLECCGFLGANAAREVKVMIPAYNCDQSTMTFSVGPKATEYAYRRCEEKGLEVVCIFHSHTESSPVPSIADVVQAENSIASLDPDFRWIIMGLRDPQNPLMKAYKIANRNYEETEIRIVD